MQRIFCSAKKPKEPLIPTITVRLKEYKRYAHNDKELVVLEDSQDGDEYLILAGDNLYAQKGEVFYQVIEQPIASTYLLMIQLGNRMRKQKSSLGGRKNSV